MVWDVCTTTRPVARKEYECDACELIEGFGLSEGDFEPEDWAVIEKAEAEGNKILPGTRYVKTKGIWEGSAATFRAREDVDAICVKYDFYDE